MRGGGCKTVSNKQLWEMGKVVSKYLFDQSVRRTISKTAHKLGLSGRKEQQSVMVFALNEVKTLNIVAGYRMGGSC